MRVKGGDRGTLTRGDLDRSLRFERVKLSNIAYKKLDWELGTPPFSLLISPFPPIFATSSCHFLPLSGEPSPFRPLILHNSMTGSLFRSDLHTSLTQSQPTHDAQRKGGDRKTREEKCVPVPGEDVDVFAHLSCSTVLGRWWAQEA
jgi:hypothetical protein